MSRPLQTIDPGTTTREAARRCTSEAINSLVVLEGDEPAGIVTKTDLVRELGSGADPGTRTVADCMSAPVHTVASDRPVRDAVAELTDGGVSRLVVIEDGTAVGMLSSSDILRHVPQALHRRQFDVPTREDHGYEISRETAYEEADWEFECRCLAEESVSVGDRVTFEKTISEQDVRTFASASGDTNRLHLEEAFAARSRFGGRIVHGTLVCGLISAALARLPGLTIYLSQDISFLAPVEIGERVRAVCTVVDAFGEDKYELTTDVFGADDEQVIEGEAAVMIDDLPAADRIGVEALD